MVHLYAEFNAEETVTWCRHIARLLAVVNGLPGLLMLQLKLPQLCNSRHSLLLSPLLILLCLGRPLLHSLWTGHACSQEASARYGHLHHMCSVVFVVILT